MTDINRNDDLRDDLRNDLRDGDLRDGDLRHDGVIDDSINRLYDAVVIDSNGDKVGGVGQVYLDDVTNKPNWVTVNTGFLGMKETFIPLQAATINADEIRVPYDKELIKGAPAVDPDGHIDEAQEAELYRYYNLDGTATTTTETVVDRDVNVADRDRLAADRTRTDLDRENLKDGEAVVHEERLNVGKEQVETGRARLRKHVVTEQQTVTVPVQKEKLVVEREPLNGEVVGDHKLAEGETEVVLHEERPVISKETVATEKVRVGKETVTENQQVTGQVGKEQVEVVQDGEIRRDGQLLDGDRTLDRDGKLLDGRDRDLDGDRDLKDIAGDAKDGIKRATDGNPNT